ncbi:MAG TPA: hypothetical protein VF172_12335 [Nitrososphaera sp.]
MKRVLVIGLGQLGLPVAKYIQGIGSTRGFEVYGYDIRKEAMDRAWQSAGIMKAADFNNFDVYIICIATHKSDDIFRPDTSGVFSVVDRISKEGNDGALVSIESTVPKGTTRKIAEILGHRMHVVHTPHRWYVHEEKEHGVNQLRVIGGVEECCLHEGMMFYGDRSGELAGHEEQARSLGLGIPIHPVKNVEIAELTKVIENAHRYLQIAFAEDLYLYCAANDLDFWELRSALNTKWNVQILEPREGIGGHCLPKDTRMFVESSSLMRSKILLAALDVDRDYRKAIVDHRHHHVLQNGAPRVVDGNANTTPGTATTTAIGT